MAKVTSKLQVTVPKALAEKYGIQPGDEIDWIPAGDSIRVIPVGRARPGDTCEARLDLFDKATVRQRERQADRATECYAPRRHFASNSDTNDPPLRSMRRHSASNAPSAGFCRESSSRARKPFWSPETRDLYASKCAVNAGSAISGTGSKTVRGWLRPFRISAPMGLQCA